MWPLRTKKRYDPPTWDVPTETGRLTTTNSNATRQIGKGGVHPLSEGTRWWVARRVSKRSGPEGQGPVCSYRDPAIFDDCTVLDNLLRSEERYPINPRYFTCVQKELSVNMRRIVGRWMLEVCEVEQCRPEVYPLAMNCLDRFLSVRPVRKCQLQLTGAVCMLLASKFRQTKPLSLERLSMFTDYSVTREELKDWELVVVSTLKWDVCGVIACDFLDHLIHRLELPKEAICSRDHIRTHAQTFISLCYTEFEFILSPASMIAAASISMAVCGLVKLNWTQKKEVLQRLHDVTSIEVDCLQDCQQRIEKTLRPPRPPTDVQDVLF
ncbi:hypothetical protein MRX96_039942 [Rhipicephalus microplus]